MLYEVLGAAAAGYAEFWLDHRFAQSHCAERTCCARANLIAKAYASATFPETVESASGAGVTGVEVGAKGKQVVIRAQAPQSRDPFRRFPVQHARIGQTR